MQKIFREGEYQIRGKSNLKHYFHTNIISICGVILWNGLEKEIRVKTSHCDAQNNIYTRRSIWRRNLMLTNGEVIIWFSFFVYHMLMTDAVVILVSKLDAATKIWLILGLGLDVFFLLYFIHYWIINVFTWDHIVYYWLVILYAN